MRTLPTTTQPKPDVITQTASEAVDMPGKPSIATWPGQAILDAPETSRVLYAAWSGDPAVVVPSPPGAGKTRLVALLAAALVHRAGLRVGIAAQTRQQAIELARRVGQLTPRAKLIWSAKDPRPDSGRTPPVARGDVRFPAEGGGILIATTARWLFAEPSNLGCDLMVVDEAWQATYADLGALGAFAAQVVCVGDPGQIDPVVTGNTSRWSHAGDGPHRPAPAALQTAHGDAIAVIALPHTWRLGPATTALLQPAFYPDLPFTSRRPPEHIIDSTGGLLPELTHRQVRTTAGPGDPALVAACANRARALLNATLVTPDQTRPVTPADLAVVCAHVTQAAAVRAMLSDLPDALVGTANQLQGLERPAVVTLHPLAGYRDASAFTADSGRACVMLSRHRAHLTVVTDAATPAVLQAADNAVPGISAHLSLLAALLETATA
jgi:hypothetical protein